MDTSHRTHRGRRPALAAAVLAVCAFGSVPALAQLPVGPDVTVPLPISGGTDGSTPESTTTTTPPPPPPPTATPTTSPAPAPTVSQGTTTPSKAAETGTGETPRRSRCRRASGHTAHVAEQTFDVARAVAEAAPAVARLRQAALPAAGQFGFPLGLAALVLAYLAVQGRLDARDPKLAAAPLSIDDDLLPFT